MRRRRAVCRAVKGEHFTSTCPNANLTTSLILAVSPMRGLKDGEAIMSKKTVTAGKPPVPKAVLDHNSQVTNKNPGTAGTNRPYDIAQGHRGMQISEHLKAVAGNVE